MKRNKSPDGYRNKILQVRLTEVENAAFQILYEKAKINNEGLLVSDFIRQQLLYESNDKRLKEIFNEVRKMRTEFHQALLYVRQLEDDASREHLIAVITDMSQPLGKAIGNRLEITEAIEIMQGKGREDITDFICELAEILLDLAQVEASQEEIRQHLVGGKALAKFEELIQAQGGDLTDLYRHSSAPVVTDIHAHETGYIKELPAMAFGKFAMQLGAGRATKSDSLNYETGIVFEKKVGDSVTQGDLIAKVYSQEILSEKMLTEFEKNVIMGSECKETTEILKIIR